MTVQEALRNAGVPAADAELLLRTITGWSVAEGIARRGDLLPLPTRRALRRLVRARAAGAPLQHLTGRVEFYGVPLAASPEALIPRQDTETLVEAAVEALAEARRPPLAVDAGCGGGAIAAALAEAVPAARIVAVERAPRALRLARENVQARGKLAGRIHLVAADLLTALRFATCDLIAANLPYVPTSEIAELPVEIRDHEPRDALDGGPDGLEPLRRLVPAAFRALKPNRRLVAEIGAGQAGRAAALLADAGFQDIRTRPDLAGIPRVVTGASRR